MPTVLGIDVGGSGIKGSPVDVARGSLLAERFRIPTPRPATPGKVIETAAAVAEHFAWKGSLGCALPAVVQRGVVRTAANIDPSWIGVDAALLLQDRTGLAVRVLNDADAAGIAEMRYGAGRDTTGVVLVLTFGTGIGSAIFVDGALVPNIELGHIELHGGPAEHYAAARLVEREAMDLQWWASRVAEYLSYIERVVSPEVIIFGGGISRRFHEFAPALKTRAELRVATLRNDAGIVGAAVAGYETFGGERR